MPYLMQLPKRPGQRKRVTTHLLAGTPDISDDDFDEAPNRPESGLEPRLAKVEMELAELKEAFDKLDEGIELMIRHIPQQKTAMSFKPIAVFCIKDIETNI